MGDAYQPSHAAPLPHAALGEPAVVPPAAEGVWVAVPEGTSETGAVASLGAVEPTQVRRPWRSTVRTVFQALVALAVLFPVLVETTGLKPEDAPWLAIPLAVAAAIARVMALPQVETFLRRFLPFLAAAPADRSR